MRVWAMPALICDVVVAWRYEYVREESQLSALRIVRVIVVVCVVNLTSDIRVACFCLSSGMRQALWFMCKAHGSL